MKFDFSTGAPEKESSVAEVFHESSKLRAFDIGRFSWINFVNSEFSVRQIISEPKSYCEGNVFSPRTLSRDAPPGRRGIEEVLRDRRSRRTYSEGSVSFEQLSKLLALSAGITNVQQSPDGTEWKLRAAPSGGGTFPLEIFLYVLRVDSLPPGLYYYNVPRNFIACIEESPVELITKAMGKFNPGTPDTNRTCAVCFVLISRLRRIVFKYGERGYRFMLMEAGHIAQNLLLLAEAEGLGAVPVGGFLDDELNNAIGLNGVDEAAQYMVFVGTR